LYGDVNYNNKEQTKETCLEKYGVPFAVYLPRCQSNGKRISKFQKKIYLNVLKDHPDAVLEHYLPDVKRFVDIYVPSERSVIECHGDYWHCNPKKCRKDYYNKSVKMTAEKIWDKDGAKRKLLEAAGYVVSVVWENSLKKFK